MGWNRLTGILASLSLLVGLLVALPAVSDVGSQPAAAASGADFDPGDIISDGVFYDSSTMTTAQVQSFLSARVPTCRSGYTCLKDYRQSTSAQPARSEGCAAMGATSNETAASIIVRVARACGINPRALIVLLEKEQGLVSDTWPTARQYRSAMGYGCPDTADCDVNYYGFFNQVYNASWQFKKYRARPDRAYVAGRYNTILWHPNAACGTSSVYIRNQATAGLYIYTPYRPNAAALANLYGTGDGCSSYGNRNFWRIFTDWFGSTHGTEPVLIKGESTPEVYLVSAGTKHHITTYSDYVEFQRGLGARVVVSQAYLNAIPTGRVATLFVKNGRTGDIALIQDGTTHHFSSCTLVAVWGSRCGDGYLTVTDAIFTRFKVGSAMTKFGAGPDGIARMLERPLAMKLIGGAPAAFNGGKAPFLARISKTLLGTYTTGRTLAAPHSYIKSKTTGQIFYVDGRVRLQQLRDWTYAPEYGLARTTVAVDDSVIAGYARAGDVGLVISCGSAVYAASNGRFVQLKGGVGGLSVAPLSGETCRLLPKSTSVVGGPLFLQANGQPEVYLVRSGKLRHITSPTQLTAQNGGSWPTMVRVAPTTLAKTPMGGAALDIGTFAKFSGDSTVYLVNGWQLVNLPDWSVADQYGLTRTAVALPAARRDGYGVAARPLGTFAKCGPTDVFAVTGGQRQNVGVVALAGNPFTTLHTSICAKIPVRTPAITGPLFLSSGSNLRVAVAGGFAPISAGAMKEANGGVVPAPLAVGAGSLAVLPKRGAPPAAGTLIRGSNAKAVVFVDGTARHALPNWGVAADLGISSRYSIVHPAEPALLKTETPSLGIFVQCGTQTYVASAGVLNRVTKELTGGLAVTVLSDAACKTLVLTGLDIRRDLYLKDASSGVVYKPSGGRLVVTASGSIPAGATVLKVDGRTIAGMITR
ncbi:hypothetical protein [Agromyces sp. Marseille-Q5079]|uniref:hypothetical protein n=1 Tax=Agromyces sp. Marseille-Q5079 TaxID=3439059 RepID=UPI003D9C85AC